MKATKIAMGLAVLVGIAALLMRQDGGAEHILITDAVATPTGAGQIIVTMTLENRGAPDRIIAVSSPEAGAIMRAADSGGFPPLPTGFGYSLAADGAHILLSGLDGEAREGRLIALTLTFAGAGEVALKAQIKAMAMSDMDHGGMYEPPDDAPKPALAITTSQAGSGVRIAVAAENFTFSQEGADGPHEEGVGHGHLYVGGMKVGRVYGDVASVGALPPGEHVVRVSLNTNDHRAYMVGGAPVTATTTIVVD